MGKQGRFTSSSHCARTLVSAHGVTVLYTGHVINTIREAAFVGCYFFLYEGLKMELRRLLLRATRDDKWSTSIAIPAAGGFAGAGSWFATFPLDCIRAEAQGRRPCCRPGCWAGYPSLVKQMLKRKGLLGF